MKPVLAIVLLFLIACTAPATTNSTNTTNITRNSTRDPALCSQIQQASSDLNFIFVFHHLQEHGREYYYNESIAYLKSVAPFANVSYNTFEVTMGDSYCWSRSDKTVVLPQLECDWDVLNQKLIACGLPNERVIIITGADVQTVTLSTYYRNSVSIINEKDFNRYAFLHEVGHLFGLQEEAITLYVRRTSPAYQPRKPNCAASTTQARDWWGDEFGNEDTGFYNGCAGHLNYIRPNKETLMGDKAPEGAGYGYVSATYLQEAYDCCYASNRSAYACETFFTTYPEWGACRT